VARSRRLSFSTRSVSIVRRRLGSRGGTSFFVMEGANCLRVVARADDSSVRRQRDERAPGLYRRALLYAVGLMWHAATAVHNVPKDIMPKTSSTFVLEHASVIWGACRQYGGSPRFLVRLCGTRRVVWTHNLSFPEAKTAVRLITVPEPGAFEASVAFEPHSARPEMRRAL
jgi:hypothetical protein